MNSVETVFEELTDLSITKLSDDYVEYVAELNKETMEKMWEAEPTSEYLANLTFKDLLKLPFDVAHRYIDSFSMYKRIEILKELSAYRLHLYEQTGKYGNKNIPGAEQLSAENFRTLLSKIKHLEILQNWLYGIS